MRPLLAAAMLFAAVPLSAAPTWHVVHGEFFDLYSNSGKAAAVDAAVWLEQFRRTVGALWKIEPTDVRRATIVQFRSEKEFSQYRLGKYSGGFFFRNEACSVMAYHNEHETDAVRSLVQHEAVHWLLASKRTRLPAWLNEGLAELYSTFSISGNTCRLFVADEQNLSWLQQNGLDSLEVAVAHDRADVDYDDREKVRDFYAQSWALTHYLVCSTDVKDGGEKIIRYLTLQQQGVPRRDAFEPAFGVPFDRMQRALSGYVNTGRYQILTVTFARDQLRAMFKAEPAPDAEVECALALAQLTGRRDADGAETRLRRAREVMPDSPLPYEGLGCVALKRGDRSAAATFFNEAAARGSRHPMAYFVPASDELHDRLSSRPKRHEMRPEDARRLSDQLRRALEFDRNLDRGAYDLGLALLFTEPVLVDDVKFMARMEASAPDPLVVRYRLAGLLHRLGDPRGRKNLETLATVTTNPLLQEAATDDLQAMDKGSSSVVIGARPVLKPKAPGPEMSVPIDRPGR